MTIALVVVTVIFVDRESTIVVIFCYSFVTLDEKIVDLNFMFVIIEDVCIECAIIGMVFIDCVVIDDFVIDCVTSEVNVDVVIGVILAIVGVAIDVIFCVIVGAIIDVICCVIIGVTFDVIVVDVLFCVTLTADFFDR